MCDACRDAVIAIAKNHAGPDELTAPQTPADLDRAVEGVIRRTIVAFSVRVRQPDNAPQEIVHDYISDLISAFELAGTDIAVEAAIAVGRMRPLESAHPPGTTLQLAPQAR